MAVGSQEALLFCSRLRLLESLGRMRRPAMPAEGGPQVRLHAACLVHFARDGHGPLTGILLSVQGCP